MPCIQSERGKIRLEWIWFPAVSAAAAAAEVLLPGRHVTELVVRDVGGTGALDHAAAQVLGGRGHLHLRH